MHSSGPQKILCVVLINLGEEFLVNYRAYQALSGEN
jgi:hypothetical protein